MTVIRVSNVSKDFRTVTGRTVRALRDVSLDVAAGECLGVIGESGSGKSTLARILLGLHRPDGGSVEIQGSNIAHGRRAAHAGTIQAVFQEPYESLNPAVSIRRVIMEPLLNQRPRLSRKEIRSRIEEVAGLVGLSMPLLDRRARELSGGQQQRVGIVRALASNPSVVVLDEPTSSLDLSVQAQILQVLAQIRSELQAAFVYISHDISTVGFLCDRVVVMYGGQIVESGPTETVLGDPRHPYTQSLLAAVVDVGADSGARKWQSLLERPTASDPGSRDTLCSILERCRFATDHCKEWNSALLAVEGDAGRAVRCVVAGHVQTSIA